MSPKKGFESSPMEQGKSRREWHGSPEGIPVWFCNYTNEAVCKGVYDETVAECPGCKAKRPPMPPPEEFRGLNKEP